MKVRQPGIGIGPAADILGVHINTLRAWTDSGLVSCQVTPGGRRRYQEEGLLKLRAKLVAQAVRLVAELVAVKTGGDSRHEV